jgi:hypothetical protein
MTSSSVTSCNKAILVCKKDSVQIPTQKSRIFCFCWPSKAFVRSSISNICLDDVVIPSGHPSMSRSFEQFKVSSV